MKKIDVTEFMTEFIDDYTQSFHKYKRLSNNSKMEEKKCK
ncbi:MAG: hypothetical protein SCAL_001376 [Candidatus Syntrophoarchaeum caldarius]|uniref:Uncharacterized protein n=1 Tax=Candidatus Syntropharchaeum caldarium TaxID=1838285 RepID=A0A1F2P893_9EURY|nr:MAG: hypothetical protein SCAL_001376 [Candidatus Syntrophoarchaeum caldarius]